MSELLEEMSEKDKQDYDRLRYISYQNRQLRDFRNKIKIKIIKIKIGIVEEELIQVNNTLVRAG